MAISSAHIDISRISEGLHGIVNDIVGSEDLVRIRRQNRELWATFFNCKVSISHTIVRSGSRGEGLEFKTSDVDYMFVERKAIALPESAVQISQLSTVPSIFILEFDRVYPGFGLVRCLKCDQNNDILYKSLEWRGRDKYVSSKSVRETFAVTKSSFVHGPCQTSRFHGIEMDQVYALKCPIWPTQAQSFIKKSLDCGWPSKDILTEICTDGCLLIPINSKQQQCSDSTDLEWKISFSLAEKRLIFSMNHCQLLCYGLLKLFLNEVLKEIPTINDLLCSYFMKTAVFWEISENTNAWLPVNFLSSFWNAFRRLISWVHVGYCPIFFIPENNMFFGKICGKKQKMLLKTLGDLYREGYFSL